MSEGSDLDTAVVGPKTFESSPLIDWAPFLIAVPAALLLGLATGSWTWGAAPMGIAGLVWLRPRMPWADKSPPSASASIHPQYILQADGLPTLKTGDESPVERRLRLEEAIAGFERPSIGTTFRTAALAALILGPAFVLMLSLLGLTELDLVLTLVMISGVLQMPTIVQERRLRKRALGLLREEREQMDAARIEDAGGAG